MKKNKVYALLLALFLSLAAPSPVSFQVFAAESQQLALGCGAPIPESSPEEASKNSITALTALSILLVIVGGGILFLDQKNKKEEHK